MPRAYARQVKADRAKHLPRRKIAGKMSISRIEAIGLAHSLDDVLLEVRGASPASEPAAQHRQA
jgi:hypothetical protein